jgi:hypothetical protein
MLDRGQKIVAPSQRRFEHFSSRLLAALVAVPVTLYQLQPFVDFNGVIVGDWLTLCCGNWSDYCHPILTCPPALCR